MILIPVDQSAIDIRPIRNIAGGREFCEIYLSEARTARENVVGQVDGGWSVVMGTLGNERAGATVLPFQAMFWREMRELIEVIRARNLHNDPLVRQRIAEAWGGLKILEMNNDRLLTAVLQGHHPGPESSVNKLYWANWHRNFGELMMQSLGPDGLTMGPDGDFHPMARSFLNSRAETIYGGTNEIQRNIVAERVLGLPK